MNKLSLNQLTQAHVDRLYNALYALADMVLQFGYETTFRRKKAVCDSGLSALESDVVVIDPKENGYSSAESCRSSLRNAIKRYGYTSIKTSSINPLVYMYKRNL